MADEETNEQNEETPGGELREETPAEEPTGRGDSG